MSLRNTAALSMLYLIARLGHYNDLISKFAHVHVITSFNDMITDQTRQWRQLVNTQTVIKTSTEWVNEIRRN